MVPWEKKFIKFRNYNKELAIRGFFVTTEQGQNSNRFFNAVILKFKLTRIRDIFSQCGGWSPDI